MDECSGKVRKRETSPSSGSVSTTRTIVMMSSKPAGFRSARQ